MARLNPKRRRKVAQAKLLQSIIAEHGPSHDDSHKLQRGSPRTSVMKYEGKTNMRAPHFAKLAPLNALVVRLEKGPVWYKDGAKNVYQGDK